MVSTHSVQPAVVLLGSVAFALQATYNKHLKSGYKQLALFRYATHFSQTVYSHLSEALAVNQSLVEGINF